MTLNGMKSTCSLFEYNFKNKHFHFLLQLRERIVSQSYKLLSKSQNEKKQLSGYVTNPVSTVYVADPVLTM